MADPRYKEKITDLQVIEIVATGITNSVGDFLNSSDLARERQKSTYEYGMMSIGHLQPQGVSQIVSSDTVEAVEGYLAILAELMLNNNKIARFVPTGQTPTAYHHAKVASDVTNYCIFKQNPGWRHLSTWIKAALLWKNSPVRYQFIEDYDYEFEEFEEILEEALDLLLADDMVELAKKGRVEKAKIPNIGEDGQPDGTERYVNKYYDVRIRRKIDKSRVSFDVIQPEKFRITRDSASVQKAAFVGVQTEMTRSEIRKQWPDASKDIDWVALGDGSSSWATMYTEEQAARKKLVGEEYWQGSRAKAIFNTEATHSVNVIECWIRVDRDGDGVAELKRFITAGSYILLEEDADHVPIAVLCPFEVPHEYHGLSVADMIRPSTLATTAILRGFVENVYLTNYAPKLADPNVVDFSALQNMKPKQIIATNGNPMTAVSAMPPETISQGTVPLLEILQMHKEQATGLSKASQGLNDTLYVSGNSEQKLARAMSAAQVRIQYMARRFAETGFKDLCEGVYKLLRKNMSGKNFVYFDDKNMQHSIDPAKLPSNMLMFVDADVGENSNSNIIKKMEIIGSQLLPALQSAGAGGAIKPEAAITVACKTLEAMDLDPLDYLVDYTAPDFQKKAQEARDAEVESQNKMRALQEQKDMLALQSVQATIALTNIQAKNAMQDNTRQMMTSLDKSYQEWSKLHLEATEKGFTLPERPNIESLLAIAKRVIDGVPQDASPVAGTPQAPQVQGAPAEIQPKSR